MDYADRLEGTNVGYVNNGPVGKKERQREHKTVRNCHFLQHHGWVSIDHTQQDPMRENRGARERREAESLCFERQKYHRNKPMRIFGAFHSNESLRFVPCSMSVTRRH